jgi:hypothetical protein
MEEAKPQITLLMALGMAATSCGFAGKLGVAACPALRAEVAALDANFTADEKLNGKLRVFVQASKDLVWASSQLEAEVASACQRIGTDIGIPIQQMTPRNGPGGAAAGACEAVQLRLDAILRQGIRLWVIVTPPVCTANASAHARCAGRCDVNSDAECRASCQTHANVHASCEPAQVSVRAMAGGEQAGQLIATLQANMPSLVNAQMALGQRIVNDAQVMVQVGKQLPRIAGNAGTKALACIGAAAEASAKATVRINVSVRASANLTARVGG